MKVPPEITYRDIERSAAIDTLIQEKLAKLERLCDYISSCHIAVEKINDRPKSGSPFRVRLDITIPPSHEIVAEGNPTNQNQHGGLDTIVRDAFSKAERQIKELTSRQREHEKSQDHSQSDETTALVVRIFKESDYGFLKTLSGEEVYFHRNSVIHDDFDRLEVGTGVRFESVIGEQGPRATTVQIVDKPGVRAGKSGETLIEPPLGWE
ncbi:MAG: HPF/RaiA family ribosome-associated protein [Leptolyngbyaceae cyanobacterium bins.59]|nr:HPF/RaiA family ribosome-associated protein [Leptolyngbyaceae cyanobacterium bins.59]